MENNKENPRFPEISVGNKLKEAREKKNLAIEQIQKTTKIHSTVLKALEEGRANELLTETYVRSFLKKYAQALGLPVNEIVKEYFPPTSEPRVPDAAFNETLLPKETRIAPRALYFTAIAALVIVAVLVIIFLAGKAALFVKNIRASHQQKPSAAFVSKKKTTKAAKTGQTKKNTQKSKQDSKEIIPKATLLNLVIKIKEPVLIKLTKDGFLIFSRPMSKGVVETVTAKESIELEISKSQAVELILNGQQVRLPARNNIFTLVITRKGVKIK